MANKINRLNELRKKNGISLKRLSTDLKERYGITVSSSQLMYYEKGMRQPRNKEIWQKLADYFGVSVAHLLGYSDFDNPLDAYLFLSDKEQDKSDGFRYVKSIILSLITQDALSKIEQKYIDRENGTLSGNMYTSLLGAIDNLRESDESKLLLWFATLEQSDQANILNLVESLYKKSFEN